VKSVLFLLLLSNFYLEAKELPLEDFITQFKKYDIQQEAILSELMRTRFNKDLNMPARQWLVEINAEYGLELNGGVQTSSKSASLSRNNRQSGTEINLEVQQNDQIGREEQVASLRIQQSLIQNSFGEQYRKRSKLLERQNTVINLQVSESYEDYLAERINQYLTFVQNFKSVESNRKLYNLSLKLESEIKLRKRKNIANQVDVDRVKIQVINRQKSVIGAEKELALTIQDLKDSLSAEAFFNVSFEPPKKIPFIEKRISFDESKFWQESRTSKLLQNQSLVADDNILVQKRNLYPEARLLFGVSRDDSQRFNATANREEALVGINFSYSLDNSQAKAQLAQARLERVQATFAKKRAKKVIGNQISSLKQKIEIEHSQLKLLESQLLLARRLAKGEKSNFTKDRSSLRDVIDAQNTLANAELELINQKILLARSIVAWMRMTDSLKS